ncbi:GTP-binding protein [Lusitaniella coriacea LEGE 07157]|uniref:GTP-binding protein n=1 Tax=Lusitaniella coriacea LEGE 07157 TaxID=945747 RepID=A0A8J7E000_9CYAN|nr:Rab family GTPase [Lusitaniella coriacea]MBE9118839.1 GTP-binding protein [Lusitaniella coriacea LEGE 07157]
MSTVSRKMCLIGDFGVGKTSLIRRFVDRQFSDKYLSTVGVKISRKAVEVSQGDGNSPKSVQLLIWDLEGHTKFKAIAPSYLQGAKGALIVADVSRLETVERLGEHIKLFSSVNPKGLMILALNKTDLVEEGKLEEFLQFAREFQSDRVFEVYLTSAKTGKDVDGMFQTLASKMLEPM